MYGFRKCTSTSTAVLILTSLLVYSVIDLVKKTGSANIECAPASHDERQYSLFIGAC